MTCNDLEQRIKFEAVVKNDAMGFVRAIKIPVLSILKGLYFPFLLNTATNQFFRDYYPEPKNIIDAIFKDTDEIIARLFQIGTTIVTQSMLINYAISNNLFKEYVGIMVATNLADYLINACKISKESPT